MAAPFLRDGRFSLVGVVHLRALPGSPDWAGDFAAVAADAEAQVAACLEGGIDTLVIENYGDRPFTRSRVPAATVAAMSVLAERLRTRHPEVRWGINVLRNDALSALSIAHAVGASFIRVNVLVGAALADQGILESEAWELAHLRRQLGGDVAVLADIAVKHAVALAPYGLEDQARDAVSRGGADALILSGRGTGLPARPEDFLQVRPVVGVPLLVGSGLSLENAPDFRGVADGAIVATSLKGPDGMPDPAKVRELVGHVSS